MLQGQSLQKCPEVKGTGHCPDQVPVPLEDPGALFFRTSYPLTSSVFLGSLPKVLSVKAFPGSSELGREKRTRRIPLKRSWWKITLLPLTPPSCWAPPCFSLPLLPQNPSPAFPSWEKPEKGKFLPFLNAWHLKKKNTSSILGGENLGSRLCQVNLILPRRADTGGEEEETLAFLDGRGKVALHVFTFTPLFILSTYKWGRC